MKTCLFMIICLAFGAIVEKCSGHTAQLKAEEGQNELIEYRKLPKQKGVWYIQINGHDYIDVVSKPDGFVHSIIHDPECKKCLKLFD